MILHADANSFYVSCERIFRPDLEHTPVAVLSNNDGITISLDSICKALGHRRGDVYFKEKTSYEADGVAVFSSNYTLYADISTRLNMLYNFYAPETELYSIDESFLFYPDWKNIRFMDIAAEIRKEALRQIHIPISVGIAPTKTLAKLCNGIAKKHSGVYSWNKSEGADVLANTPVGDVWGIGPSKAEALARLGIRTALDLALMPPGEAKRRLSITGFRTVQELNGIQAIEHSPPGPRQTITTSRSFSCGVSDIAQLETALAEYAQLAVSHMRAEGSACTTVSVNLMTARSYGGANKAREYFGCASAAFPRCTSYLPAVLSAARRLLRTVYRSGYTYRKLAINLLGLEKDEEEQCELFDAGSDIGREKRTAVMSACDTINAKYGRGMIHPATRDQAAEADAWKMGRAYLSPAYTTRLADLPEIS